MINVGEVIRLKSGEHAVVVKLGTDTFGLPVCECLTGEGEMISRLESDITDEQRTKHKIGIKSVMDTLKVFDRAAGK